MALSAYDNFLAPASDRGTFDYIDPASTTRIDYPTHDQVNIFGPLYLPRVYGKDLTAFEIASSGSVAITLNDIHSFDLTRDNTSSNIVLQTYSNDSFNINVAASNMYLNMTTSNDTITMFSSNDVIVHADNVLSLQGKTIDMQIGDSFNLHAKNIALLGDSNVSVTAALGEMRFSASNSNVTFAMAENDANLWASHDVSMSAGNVLFAGAVNDVFVTASNQSMFLSAAGGAAKITLDHTLSNVNVVADNKFTVATGGQINMTSTNESVLLRAAGNDVRVELVSASSNLDMYAKNNVSITADSALTLASINECIVNAGNSIAMNTANNMTIGSSNAFLLTASNDVTVNSISASLNLTAAGGKAFVSLDAPTQSLYIGVASNIAMTCSNDFTVAASNNYSLTAANNVKIQAVSQSLNLSAAAGQAYADFDAPTTSLTIGTANRIFMSASNNFVASSAINTAISASNDLVLTGVNTATVQRNATNYVRALADNTIQMVSDGNAIITAHKSKVTINGDVEVFGAINSITINQSNLEVADKTITCAYDINNIGLNDGPTTNDKSGLIVAGIEYGSNARSILWNCNTGGQNDIGGAADCVNTESFWDLRGGAFHISQSNVHGECTFGLRINEHSELEIVKKLPGGTFKRIAKFGRTL
jgi:uncharacterized protein (DUF2345 family)